MPSLSKELRKTLSDVTLAARTAAEAACRAALENLAVHEGDYRPHMTADVRQLRNRLRARGRALGDRLDATKGTQEIKHLAEDAAYEHWHRLLFTRFLAENSLLHTDEEQGNVPVTLEDCEELAPELGAKDGFDLACRFAEKILPGVFRSSDPVFELNLAKKDQVELCRLLASLPPAIFTADDSLGWTYQFWQTQRKAEVNLSGKKIGADELSPVTQLFTEDYMVEFLLHNTLGAWWAGRCATISNSKFQIANCPDETDARAAASLLPRDGLPAVTWTYLRFVQPSSVPSVSSVVKSSWTPAAGTFEGWPSAAKDIRFLDPCMGSGHFPVFALPILARLRMEEEGLTAKAAVFAVLRDNIHGLELDPRCTQIGAFNLALTAWKFAGYQPLPPLHVACCGLAPQSKLADWVKLAGENDKLKRGMERLYRLFEQAPVLGSLINPRVGGGDLVEADYHELQPLLEKALQVESKDDALREMVVTAQGIAKAAEILAGKFTLVATNVPYLGRLKQDNVLRGYCEKVYPKAKADLATCFIERCLELSAPAGTSALVAPQIWLFLKTYGHLRTSLLETSTWSFVGKLGTRAFESIGGEVVNVTLQAITRNRPSAGTKIFGLDVGGEPTVMLKSKQLKETLPILVSQAGQSKNPNSTIVFEASSGFSLLGEYANSIQGASTLDIEMFRFCFWEVSVEDEWVLHQSTPAGGCLYSGLEYVSIQRNLGGRFQRLALELKAESRLGGAWSGQPVWGKLGIACAWMGSLPAAIYLGAVYDNSIAAIVPKDVRNLSAIWTFCSSATYLEEVRKLNQKSQVANATLAQVPFDLSHWQKVAAEKYPHGLPKPFSSDPTQWLFNGHPAGADQPLHVAVARLLGYQWPRQTGSSFPDCPALGPDGLEKLADDDGIVCLPAINREQPAATRLRALLAEALGTFDERQLLTACGAKSKTLEDWLRDEFFEQHCTLFHQRSFLWHIWDGRKDGFAAVVNYHRLDNAALQKLTYTTLGNWIQNQDADAKADKPGAAERLAAAQFLQAELIKILEGEAPYDIFIRWKPLNQQPIGWHPDLNDGVRLNIRPFLTANDVAKKGAGLLRTKPNIKWDKDRGKEPIRPKSDYPWFWCEEEPDTDPEGGKDFHGHRWNNVHLTLDNKRKARS